MPFDFYENQPDFAIASQLQSGPSAHETDRTDRGMASSSARQVNPTRPSAGRNTVLPNPPPSPSQIPVANNAVTDSSKTDVDAIVNRFKAEMTKSIERNLGITIKPIQSSYQKPYPSTYDVLRAPLGWKMPDF